MEIDTIVNRILRDMKMAGLIAEDYAGEIRFYLNALAIASFEQGTKHYGHSNGKKIVQYDRNGVKIAEYENQLKASRAVGYTDRAILRSLQSGKKTRTGHYWKYVNKP